MMGMQTVDQSQPFYLFNLERPAGHDHGFYIASQTTPRTRVNATRERFVQ
jgi:hypothetical protein